MTLRRSDIEQPPRSILSSGRNWTKAVVTLHWLKRSAQDRPAFRSDAGASSILPAGMQAGSAYSGAEARSVSSSDSGQAFVVLKDFAERGALVRATIGRFSTSREARAYARLGGVRGVPEFFGRIDGTALAMAFVPGTSLRDLPRRSLPASFFEDLERLIAAVHARGVAIADFHHRNVIVRDGDRSPALIDLSMAMVRPATWNLIGRWLFHQALALDRLAFERIREKYMALQPGAGGSDTPPGEQGAAGAADAEALRERGPASARLTGSPADAFLEPDASGAHQGSRRVVVRSAQSVDPSTDPGSSTSRPSVPLYVLGRRLKRVLRRIRGRS